MTVVCVSRYTDSRYVFNILITDMTKSNITSVYHSKSNICRTGNVKCELNKRIFFRSDQGTSTNNFALDLWNTNNLLGVRLELYYVNVTNREAHVVPHRVGRWCGVCVALP
jgi:hypothetical protein